MGSGRCSVIGVTSSGRILLISLCDGTGLGGLGRWVCVGREMGFSRFIQMLALTVAAAVSGSGVGCSICTGLDVVVAAVLPYCYCCCY